MHDSSSRTLLLGPVTNASIDDLLNSMAIGRGAAGIAGAVGGLCELSCIRKPIDGGIGMGTNAARGGVGGGGGGGIGIGMNADGGGVGGSGTATSLKVEPVLKFVTVPF